MKKQAQSARPLAFAAMIVSLSVFSQANAALVTLAVTDTAGQSSFVTDSLSHWSPAGDPVAGNDYLVASGRTLRNVADSTGTVTFAGDSLTLGDGATTGILVLKNLTGAIVNVNNFTLNNGEIQAGGTAAGAANITNIGGSGITLGATGSRFNSGTGGRGLIIDAPIGGSGSVSIISGGFVQYTNAANNYTGTTTVSGGLFRASDGTSLPTASNLILNGGAFGTETNFTRSFGTGAGQVQLGTGNAGFVAFGGTRNVNLDGGTALVWGTAPFAIGTLILGHSTSDGTLDFQNAIDLGTAARTISVDNGSATIDAILSGPITGAAKFAKTGGGTLVLSNSGNTFAGGVDIGANGNGTRIGVVRATATNALGTGLVTIGLGGNDATARLELDGGITLGNVISLPGRAGTSVAIQSTSGSNTLSGRIDTTSGGTNFIVQADSGSTLALTGAADAGGVSYQSTTGARTLTVQGDGNVVISGIVQNGAGTAAVTKAGVGTLTLSGANTYSGATTISNGTLAIGANDRIADVSNLVLGGGTFSTNGFSDVLALASMSASSMIDLGNGASVLRFADSSGQTWVGTLTIANYTPGVDQLFVGATSSGLTPAQLGQISFAGIGAPAQILASGEVVPLVPEPTTFAGLVLGAATITSRRRSAR
jgi:autotransporter-associated beta strand protein